MLETLLGAAFIFFLRVCDVSLGTVKLMMAFQGRRYTAAAIGFVEVTIFVIAIGQVVGQLDNVVNVLAYSSGFACGTTLGIALEGKLALGNRMVRIITHRQNDALIEALRAAGFGVTRLTGEGKEGKVYLLFSLVRRKRLDGYLKMVRDLAPKAFVSVEDTREVSGGYLPLLQKAK